VVALMMGIACHQGADGVWHPGFLPAAFAEDGAVEAVVEVFVDIFCQWEQGERRKFLEQWYLPVDLLYGVFEEEGYALDPGSLELGALGMRVGLFLERLVGPGTYLFMQWSIPWTHANYETYPDGGLDDCAATSAEMIIDLWEGLNGAGLSWPSAGIVAPDWEDPLPAFLPLAYELLFEGAVEVPVEWVAPGILRIGEPVVRDEERLAEVLAQLR